MNAEQMLTRLLRNLPRRPAPATLEARVLEQLERRRAAPWWRRGFIHWPAAARVSFVSACCALIGASLLDTRWSTLSFGVLQHASGWALSWVSPAVAAVTAAPDAMAWITLTVSSEWFYEFAVVTGVLYAALFGLGVAAYRALYLASPSKQVIR